MCYHQLELEEKFYQFYNDFFSFWPKNKNNKQKLAYKLIFLLSFDFKKIYFQILFLPLWQRARRKDKVYQHVKIVAANMCVLLNRNRQNCVKTTNQN